jgi:peptidoglycan/xylan/chitin deacetylase (PgdA/CDA1 family)
MEFCIRDDDTSFFTSPDQLEAAYGDIAQRGPVSLAVVPYHRAGTSESVPEEFRGHWTVHPLHKNEPLVRYLRQAVAKNRFEIMLHGYYHDEPDGRPEFAQGDDLARRVDRGRKYLEDLLGGGVRVFVAPRNTIGRRGLDAINRAGLHLGGVAGMRSGWPLFARKSWSLWFRLRRWQNSGGVGIPWVLDLGGHREITGNAITPSSSVERNRQAYEAALRMSGVFCAATHYWERLAPSAIPGQPPVGDQLRYFIERTLAEPQIVRWRSVGEIVSDKVLRCEAA